MNNHSELCKNVSKGSEMYIARCFLYKGKYKVELYLQERLRLYAIKRPDVRFSAGGFFEIGFPLVTSVIIHYIHIYLR